MAVLVQFLVYNLLFSLGAGLLTWLIVVGLIRLLGIQSSAMKLCFFSLPILKSLLILMGIGLVLPWSDAWFARWHNLALPVWQVLPFLLIWMAAIYLVYRLIVRRARGTVLQEAQPAPQTASRLTGAYQAVLEDFLKIPCPECSDDLCCSVEMKTKPGVMISRRLNSPMALTDGGEPLILFPKGLIPRLSDAELAGALGHELAHFHLRRPDWCSAGMLNKLTLINPMFLLLGEYLRRQEEKACDELAVSILGQPEVYAGMLIKSYSFAKEQAGGSLLSRMQVLPRLASSAIGFKPLLSERVENLLQPEAEQRKWKIPNLVAWLVWGVLFSLLFFNYSFIAF